MVATLFARVVPDLPIYQSYSYLIPEEWRSIVRSGFIVRVPLHGQQVNGVVIAVDENTEEVESKEFKELTDLLENYSLLDENMILFTRWIANYYLCPWIKILKLCLPKGCWRTTARWVSLPTKVREEFTDGTLFRGLTGIRKKIVEMLFLNSPVPVHRVCKALGYNRIQYYIRALENDGIIKIEDRQIKNRIHDLIHHNYRISNNVMGRLGEIYEDKRRKKQAQILRLLLSHHPNSVSWAEMREEFGGDRGSLKSLIRDGWVEEYSEKVSRTPYCGLSLDSNEMVKMTPEQQLVFDAVVPFVRGGGFQTDLLFGVTGSGKTEIYLQLIREVIACSKQAIVLVPEISLTPLMVSRFRARFRTQVAVLHSALSPGERRDEWYRLKRGEARVAIGPRSALFAPCGKLGLIIVDEEHDNSYKQGNYPRYNARDLAVVRAKMMDIPVLLGSATPSLESYHNAVRGRYRLLALRHRVKDRILPEVQIIRMVKKPKQKTEDCYEWLSDPLKQAIQSMLLQKKQAIILLNRRGYARTILCSRCGYIQSCPHCAMPVIYHRTVDGVRCHYCNYKGIPMQECMDCHGEMILMQNPGIQKIEEELAVVFPGIRVIRMDSDSANTRNAHIRILKQFENAKADILLGTQMVAKGHDFPNVLIVGVINADGVLNTPDFRSAEKTFQLLTQVVGRSGRGDDPGTALVQCINSDHFAIRLVQTHNYEEFYRRELLVRAELELPPFVFLTLIRIEGVDMKKAFEVAKVISSKLITISRSKLQVIGPAPSPIFKIKDDYRWQILIKSNKRGQIQHLIRTLISDFQRLARREAIRVQWDVDPYELF